MLDVLTLRPIKTQSWFYIFRKQIFCNPIRWALRSPSSAVDGGQYCTKWYIRVDTVLQAAFMAGNVWGVQLDPTRMSTQSHGEKLQPGRKSLPTFEGLEASWLLGGRWEGYTNTYIVYSTSTRKLSNQQAQNKVHQERNKQQHKITWCAPAVSYTHLTLPTKA